MMKLRTSLFALMAITSPLWSQTGTVKQVKITDFDLQSSLLVTASGRELSMSDYKAPVY